MYDQPVIFLVFINSITLFVIKLNFNFPAPESLISAEVPTDPGGKPITKIKGNQISLTFPQPSDFYGPFRYVKIRNDISFAIK